MCEDLYLILVHKGGTGETGSLQLAQLLAQLLGLRQNGDVVGVAQLRDTYNVTVLPQAKKLGKQLGQLEASGFAGAAFMDKDEVKIFAQQ